MAATYVLMFVNDESFRDRPKDEVAAIYAENHGRYGSPRVQMELRERGQRTGRKRIEILRPSDGLLAFDLNGNGVLDAGNPAAFSGTPALFQRPALGWRPGDAEV